MQLCRESGIEASVLVKECKLSGLETSSSVPIERWPVFLEILAQFLQALGNRQPTSDALHAWARWHAARRAVVERELRTLGGSSERFLALPVEQGLDVTL